MGNYNRKSQSCTDEDIEEVVIFLVLDEEKEVFLKEGELLSVLIDTQCYDRRTHHTDPL